METFGVDKFNISLNRDEVFQIGGRSSAAIRGSRGSCSFFLDMWLKVSRLMRIVVVPVRRLKAEIISTRLIPPPHQLTRTAQSSALIRSVITSGNKSKQGRSDPELPLLSYRPRCLSPFLHPPRRVGAEPPQTPHPHPVRPLSVLVSLKVPRLIVQISCPAAETHQSSSWPSTPPSPLAL